MDRLIASHALNRVSNTVIPELTVIRQQDQYNLANLIIYAKNQTIIPDKAFISTSHEAGSYISPLTHPVQVIFSNIIGKSVSAISKYDKLDKHDEKEYLIPPSMQIKWTGYQKVDGKHIFTAEGANVLLDKKYEIAISNMEKDQNAIKNLVNNYNKLYKDESPSDQNIKNFVKTIANIREYHGVINLEQKEEYYKTQIDDKSRYEKDLDKALKLKSDFNNIVDKISKSFGLPINHIKENTQSETVEKKRSTEEEVKEIWKQVKTVKVDKGKCQA